MITMPVLQTELLDLLRELHGTDVKLIIGGGFGIYLRDRSEINSHNPREWSQQACGLIRTV